MGGGGKKYQDWGIPQYPFRSSPFLSQEPHFFGYVRPKALLPSHKTDFVVNCEGKFYDVDSNVDVDCFCGFGWWQPECGK